MVPTATTRHATPSALAMLLTAFARAVAHQWKIFANRLTVREIADLSDSELADIGLTRWEVNRAFVEPIDVDPTARLAECARRKPMTMPGSFDSEDRNPRLPSAARGRNE